MLVALSEGKIGAPMFVLIVHIACGLSSALFAFLITKQRRVVWHNIKIVTKSLGFEEWLYLILIGLVATLFSFCFVVAMESTSKVGAAIIIETWPLLAMFIAPLLITKNWAALTIIDYICGFIALCGVGLIMFGDQNNVSLAFNDFDSYKNTPDYNSLIGIIAALFGSISIALSITLSTEVSNRISKVILQEKEYSMNCAFMAETIRRIVALPPTFLLLYAFSDDISITWEGAIITSAVGIFIFNIGNVAISLSLLKAVSSNINMIYYITPVMSVVWLYMIGKGDMTPLIFMGGILVILSNLILIMKNKSDNDKVKKLSN